ncbi:MAG: leucine-rich repeat domain-containing protein [Pseudomonadales bacterium]|nr:leucine-rich repeat domain-containing protein [Pseudomonadales bacterium]MCP5357493.1 leucine-rich repeat domain-containing protein [Pseudomonadales bacterium]
MKTRSACSPFPYPLARPFVRLTGLLLVGLLCACSQRYAVSINNQTIIDQRPNAGNYRFDDPGLQGCVNFALQQPDATLETIAVLSCSGWEIENIEGIDALRALQFLDLSNNRINSLAPLAPLRRLSSISLTDNRVRDIDPLNALNSLTSAVLTGNNNISCAQLDVLQQKLGDNLRRPTSCEE